MAVNFFGADDGTGDDARHSVWRRAHEHTFTSSLCQQATATSFFSSRRQIGPAQPTTACQGA